MKIIFCVYLVFIIASCLQKKQHQKLSNFIDTSHKGTPKIDTIKISPIAESSDTIVVKFLKDSIATTIGGLLKQAPQHLVILINIKQGKNLSAILYPNDPKDNIRINQIFTPGGKADGPFGREITKRILEQGIYKLFIGRDLMAEGGASAIPFMLRITVK